MRIFLSTSLSARFEAKEEKKKVRMHLSLSLGEVKNQDSNQWGRLRCLSTAPLAGPAARAPEEAPKAKIALLLS